MRRPELIVCSAFLVATLWAAPASAFDMPAQGKWWHDQHMISTLNLSQEQSKKIEKIFSHHRKELLKLSALLRQRYLMLENFLESQAQEVDRERLSKMVDAVQEARSNLEKSRLMMLLEVRRVLSREQTDTLRRMRREMMRHMGQMGMGPGGHMGGRGMGGR